VFKGNSRVLLMFLLLFLGVAAFLVVSLPYVSRLEGEVDSENDVATDLVTSLACYAALHGGRLPASEAAFRSSDVVIVSSEGVVCLRVPAVYTAQLGHFQNSIVKDLSEYHITWGANLDILRLDTAGRAVDASGREVRLIAVTLPALLFGTHDVSSGYSSFLLDFYKGLMKESKTSSDPQ